MADRFVGGVDLGATHLRAAVAGPQGRFLGRADGTTPPGDGDEVTDALLDALRDACVEAGLDPTDLSAVGVASVGPLDHDAGAAVDPPNVDAARIDLVEPVERLCSADVVLANDCVAGAIGERYFGDGGPDLVYVTLSTGVGAGAIVDGHALRGHRGNAAEMGHVVVEPGGRECGCGGSGHWEAYAAGAAIPGFAREVARTEGIETALPLADVDAADVVAADEDDPLAERVLDLLGEYNARGVAATIHAFDPGEVVVGGAVARNNPGTVLTPVRDRLPDMLAVEAPPVRLTGFEDAVLRGAVAAVLSDGHGAPTNSAEGRG